MPSSPPSRRALSPAATLAAAESLRHAFGPASAASKVRLLAALERAVLPRARDVLRLHELLCFWRAYPDDAQVLARVERLLARFDQRADLARHAPALADSGIAGTVIRYRFFAPTARWLARRWPARLHIEWPRFDEAARLEPWLPLMVHPAEVPGLDEYDLAPRQWIERLKGPRETDAAFLVERLAALPMDDQARETLHDQLDVPMVLEPGRDTPARTREKVRGAVVQFQRRALSRARPAPAEVLRLAPRAVRELSPRDGERWVDRARAAMVTRSRDLDAFSNGDPRDVRLVDFGGGCQFACIGVRPDRRLLLESVYGYLTLKNGVPIGYVLTASLFGSAEIAYNVFDTFRGAEAAPVYGRVMAMTRWLFGSDAFTIPPYQLGDGNDEAVESGAWWFYRKVGFAPRDPAVIRSMRAEETRLRRDPAHRSSLGALRRLARAPLYLYLDRRRADVMGELGLANVGLHVSRFLAERFGHDRETARQVCAAEAASALGEGPDARWTEEERAAWERWAPLLLLIPGLDRWSEAERGAAVGVVRAKGGRRESEFVRRFDAHARLRTAIRRLAGAPPE